MQQIIIEIIEICLIPLLSALTGYLITWIKARTNLLKAEKQTVETESNVKTIQQTVQDCVVYTNQTLVDSLKKKNEFTEEQQKAAFEKTYSQILNTLTQSALQYLSQNVNDTDNYLTTMIEAEVNRAK